MKILALFALLLAACTGPRVNAGVSLGADGVSVTPSLSARVGGVGVSLAP